MTFEKCLALVFSLMILGQAYLVRRWVGTWLFPACLFGLFWFGYTFVPLAILYWVPADPFAIAFIFLCTAAFSAGSLLFDWKTAFAKNARKRETATRVYGSHFLKGVFYLATLSSLAFIILYSRAQGFSLHDFLWDFYESATDFALLRYTESLNASVYGPMSIVCAYVGVTLGGLLYSAVPTKRGRRLILGWSFLPAILVTLTQLSKGLLFLSVVFFYAGLLAYRVSKGSLRLFEKGSMKPVTLSVGTLMLIATISMFARGLHTIEDSGELTDAFVQRYTSYAFGHIYAFSDWFAFLVGRHSEITYAHESATFGFYTFAPLFKLMGSHRVLTLTIFDEVYTYGDLLTTNIFTFFRGLIQDFGLIGSLLFMLTAGVLIHRAFHAMLRSRRPVFSVAVFIFMMGYSYLSFGLSLLIFNSMYVTFVAVWIVLQVNNRITQRADWQLAPAEFAHRGGTPSAVLGF